MIVLQRRLGQQDKGFQVTRVRTTSKQEMNTVNQQSKNSNAHRKIKGTRRRSKEDIDKYYVDHTGNGFLLGYIFTIRNKRNFWNFKRHKYEKKKLLQALCSLDQLCKDNFIPKTKTVQRLHGRLMKLCRGSTIANLQQFICRYPRLQEP